MSAYRQDLELGSRGENYLEQCARWGICPSVQRPIHTFIAEAIGVKYFYNSVRDRARVRFLYDLIRLPLHQSIHTSVAEAIGENCIYNSVRERARFRFLCDLIRTSVHLPIHTYIAEATGENCTYNSVQDGALVPSVHPPIHTSIAEAVGENCIYNSVLDTALVRFLCNSIRPPLHPPSILLSILSVIRVFSAENQQLLNVLS